MPSTSKQAEQELPENIAELKRAVEEAQTRVNAAIDKLKSAEEKAKQVKFQKVAQAIKDAGIDIRELAQFMGVSISKPAELKTKKTKNAPKYFNPTNPDETWTGGGRDPVWIVPFKTSADGMKPRTYKPEVWIENSPERKK